MTMMMKITMIMVKDQIGWPYHFLTIWNIWKWLEMSGNGLKCLEMAGYGWHGCKWLECESKWLKMVGNRLK